MGKRMSLRGKLISSVCVLMALLLLLVCGGGYYVTVRAVAQERAARMREAVRYVSEALSDALEGRILEVTTAATALEGGLDSREEVDQSNVEPPTREQLAAGIVANIEEGSTPGSLPSEGLLAYHVGLFSGLLYEDGVWQEAPNLVYAPWFSATRESDGVHIAMVFHEGREGVLTVSMPLRVRGQTVGVLAAEYAAKSYLEAVAGLRLFDQGTALLLDAESRVLAMGGEGLPGIRQGSVFSAHPQFKEIDQGLLADMDVQGGEYRTAHAPVAGGWTVVYTVRPVALVGALGKLLWVVPILVIAGVLLTALLLWWRLQALMEPVEHMAQTAGEMARGRYNMQLEYEGRDEFGALCENMRAACVSTKSFVDDISHTLGRMALGDFTVKAAEDDSGDFAAVHKSINTISNSLHEVFLQINETARWGMVASHRVSGIAGHLMTGNEAQKNSAEELGKAATLLRHESNQNITNATKAQEMSLNANADLRETLYHMRKILDSLRMLRKLSGEITGYLGEVKNVSKQITMLCLNAAAEASRLPPEDALAFSFVTDEMHKLSVRCEKAAGSADELIARSRDGLEFTTEYSGAASDAIRSAAKKNGQANEYAGRVVSASQLQSQAAAMVRKESAIMSAMMQVNIQVAEQCGTAGETLSEQAKTLSSMATAFYTKGSNQGDKSAPIIFDAENGDFSVTDEK